MGLTIVARKPRSNAGAEQSELIVVDRGEGVAMRYVCATATPHSLASGEWFWGYYRPTLEEAMEIFNGGYQK